MNLTKTSWREGPIHGDSCSRPAFPSPIVRPNWAPEQAELGPGTRQPSFCKQPMRPKGKPADLEARRLEAIDLLSTGKKPAEVAKMVGASASSVKRWKDALSQGGRDALRAKRHPGRRPRMTSEQKSQLLAWLS